MDVSREPENKEIWHVDDMLPDDAFVLVWFEYKNPAKHFCGYGLGHYLKDVDDWVLNCVPSTRRKDYSLEVMAWHYLPPAPQVQGD